MVKFALTMRTTGFASAGLRCRRKDRCWKSKDILILPCCACGVEESGAAGSQASAY
jgi:hypothetical protein